MINWNTDEKRLKKLHPKEYTLWRLTQLINYGLDGEKIDQQELRRALEFLLWNKKWKTEQGLLPDRSNFWQWYWKKNLSSTASI